MASGGGVIYPQKNGKGAARCAAQRLKMYYVLSFLLAEDALAGFAVKVAH